MSVYEEHLAMTRLAEHESQVRFEVLPSVGISEGRQSRVSILQYEVSDKKDRVLWKRMGAGKGLIRSEAEQLHERLHPYRAELVSAGWNVPEVFYTAVTSCENEYQIFSYEHLVGRGDGDTMFANREEPNFRKWHLLRRTVETLAAYRSLAREKIAGKEVSRLPHGLDLKLANVVLDESGTLWFVDLFGPKELNADGSWRTFSTKLDSLEPQKLLAVCATREGTILRMYRLAEKIWTASGEMSSEKLRGNFVELLESLEIPTVEIAFIADQLHADFRWLDDIYRESSV
jgi:hypothetical protein